MQYKDKPLVFECSCVIGDEIWFSARDFNGLFKGNLLNGTVEFMGFFPKMELMQSRAHRFIIRDGDKLFFAPKFNKYMHSYNINTKKFKLYEVQGEGSWKYASAYKCKEHIYFFPEEENKIMRFSCKDEEISYIEFDEKYIKQGELFRINTAEKDGMVFMAVKHKNILLAFDMQSEKLDLHSVGAIENKYHILAEKDDRLFLKIVEQPEIVIWNLKKQKIESVHRVQTKILYESLQLGKEVLGNSFYGEGVQLLDIATMHTTNLKREKENKNLSAWELIHMFEYRNALHYLWSGDGNIYNAKDNVKLVGFRINEKIKKDITETILRERDRTVFGENTFFSLADYTEYLTQGE